MLVIELGYLFGISNGSSSFISKDDLFRNYTIRGSEKFIILVYSDTKILDERLFSYNDFMQV